MVKQVKIWDPNYWNDGKKMHFNRKGSEPWRYFGFTLLKDDSGVFGKCPAQHPQRPSDLPTPEEVERVAANGFPVKPPKWVLDKGIKANADSHSNKIIPVVVRQIDDSDSDLDAFLAGIAAGKSVSGNDAKPIAPPDAAAISASASDEQSPTVDDRVNIPKSIRITLPKFEDPFTRLQITNPAISPYGHVCEYDSWFKVLSTPGCEGICPFTKKALKDDDLIKLTPGNIEKYIQKIVNQEFALRNWRDSNSTLDLQQGASNTHPEIKGDCSHLVKSSDYNAEDADQKSLCIGPDIPLNTFQDKIQFQGTLCEEEDTVLKRSVPTNLDRCTPREHKRSKTQALWS